MAGQPPYHFVTHWRVQASPKVVYQILDNTADLPRWWPAVYISVAPTEPGDRGGIGAVFDLHTRGWLPYTLRWKLRIVEKQPPRRIALEASGDLVGHGVWTLSADGPWVNVTFDWQVQANKPLLRRWSWLLWPLFAANHHWAMGRGQESLVRELAFRQAPPKKWESFPPPPQPSNISVAGLLVIMAGAALIFLAALYLIGWYAVRLFAPG